MIRFAVPGGFVVLISTLGLGLIFGIVGRSPQTHSNIWPQGFDRAPIAYVGSPQRFESLGLAVPAAPTAEPATRGRLLFVGHGCATCHGVASYGGVVGPNLDLVKLELWLEDFTTVVRKGPGGMPAYPEESLSQEELEAIYAFLKARP